MAEPAIHDGDLAFDADASSCAMLPCTSATPSTCQAWEPVQLAPCLGLMLDQLHTRHAESSTSSQTSSMVSMHLLKAYLKRHDHCVHLNVEQGHWLAQEQNSQSGGPGHPQLKASWPCVAIKPCLQHVPN